MTTAIQPCEHLSREITPHISTHTNPTTDYVWATYKLVQDYADPNDAPVYARMRRVGNRWEGSIMLQAFAKDEVRALTELCSVLLDMSIGAEADATAAMDIVEQWASWQQLPWESQPLGLRPAKPRRHRHWLKDQHTGKHVAIYKDTGARYAHLPSQKDENK